MSFARWLRYWKSGTAATVPARSRRARLQLEVLEDRLAPAVQAVSFPDPTMIADTGGDESRLVVAGTIPNSSVSADGRYVAFVSVSANLAPGQIDTNAQSDIFLRDRVLGTTALVSHSSAGNSSAGNQSSDQPVISADGRFVAFSSNSTNLVTGQVDPSAFSNDVFLYEVATGAITLVSHAAGASATVGNNSADSPMISADGRFVAFQSSATNLVTGQIDTFSSSTDVFLFDRLGVPGTTAPGTIALVSHTPAAGNTTAASGSNAMISADGKQVAFLSGATNVVTGQVDTNGQADVFLYDVTTQAVTLVSHASSSPTTTANGTAFRLAISSDDGSGNHHVAFHSTGANLVPGQVDTNGSGDVFLYSRASGTVALVSHVPASLATTGNGDSGTGGIAISQNGQYVVFAAAARNLVTGEVDSNGTASDVYLYERATGTITLVSHVPGSSVTTGSSGADAPAISADGGFVAFQSTATNFVTGQVDTNAGRDVFLFTRATGAVTLVSHASGSTTATGNFLSETPAISADGNFIAFNSRATDLSASARDTNNRPDVVLHDRVANQNSIVSRRAAELATLTGNNDSFSNSSVSADGRYVAFHSGATNLVAGQVDVNYSSSSTDVFLLDRLTGTTSLVSHANGLSTTVGNNRSLNPVISADGKYVVFESLATNLVAGQVDTNNISDLFLYTVATGTVSLISHQAGALAATGSSIADSPSISADGAFIAFRSASTNLVTGQVGTGLNVYLYTRATGGITLVSHADGLPLSTGNSSSQRPVLSADGNFIAYESAASNLVSGQVDAAGFFDVFLFDRALGTSVLISHAAAAPAQAGNQGSASPSISADGSYVAFSSFASDMVAGQIGTVQSIFLYERSSHGVTLVSHASGSLITTANANFSDAPHLSSDGRYVAYHSPATNLVLGQIDTNFGNDVFLYDRMEGSNRLVSHVPGTPNAAGNGASLFTGLQFGADGISADGNHVAFLSSATNLVPGQIDANNLADVFRYERTTDTMLLASHALGAPTTTDNNENFGRIVISGDGSVVVFNSTASNLVAGDFNNNGDVFAFVAASLNAAPTDLALSNASVPENQPSGTVVGTFSTTDPDTGNTHSYTLVSGAGDGDNASFTIAGNVLHATTTFDFEDRSSYSIRVRTTDQGGLPFEKSVIIAITNVNETPTANAGGPYTVAEGGTVALTGSGSDPDAGDSLLFEWDLDNNGTFETAGQNPIFSAAGLDGLGTRTVTLRVTDNGGLSNTHSATITITNVAPTAVNDSVTTDEDQAISVAVLANDSDPAGALDPLRIDSVTSGSKGTTAIDTKGTADSTDDEIVYTPNAGATGSDSFTYTISDGDGGTATATVTVQIRNRVDLSGRVFDDRDNDGLFEPGDGEIGIGGVTVQLFDQTAAALIATQTTAADGTYVFDFNLGAGTYRIVAAQPAGYLDGRETAGNLGGSVDNTQDSNQISGINVGGPGTTADAADYLFAKIGRSQAIGLVWSDTDNDGQVDFGETAIPGVVVQLTGLDDRGNAVNRSTTTDGNGVYAFSDLRPSNAAGYTIHEVQPAGYLDGLESLGTVNGVAVGDGSANDTFSAVVLPRPHSLAENYNFGERPSTDGSVTRGQTAGIGFWQNRNGQNLLKALNGGSSATQLGNWLAANFPNLYGVSAGANNLAGKTNAQVAAFYKTLFARTAQTAVGGGPAKVDAQVLATALAVYVTNQALAGTTATAYGFLVTESGVGTRTFNVGSNGTAFGMDNGSEATVLNLLLAVNTRSRNGLLYDLDGDGDADDGLETSYRILVNNVFSAINEVGAI